MDLRIKEICKEKGVTITGLAERMNVKIESLSRSINGNPTLETLEKVANALAVPMIELFAANCPKCGMRFAGVTEVAAAVQNLSDAPPPLSREAKKGSLLEFIEKHTEKNGGNFTGLIKILRECGGGDVLVSQVDDKFYNGFLEYLPTVKRFVHGKVITEMYQKRMRACFDEVIALLPDRKK